MDKISFKNDTICTKYTPRMSDVSPYKACKQSYGIVE